MAIKEKTEFLKLTAGKPFLLESAENVWQVYEGTAEVYAILADEHHQQVFLFAGEPGQTLFGMPPNKDKVQLMVMSSEEVTLKVLSRSQLLHSAVQSKGALFEAVWFMIEEWLNYLLSSSLFVAPPRNFLPVEVGSVVALQAGQTVQSSRDFIWARRIEGTLKYGPLPEIKIGSGMNVFLTERSWLLADDEVKVLGLSTEEVFPPVSQVRESEKFWEPLEQSHQLFRILICRYFLTESLRDSERLITRRLQREKLLSGAATYLLRTDLPQTVAVNVVDISQGSLLSAMRAVARRVGVGQERVRLPKGQDPRRQDSGAMQNIARLAGIMIRTVMLEKGWHLRDNGPLLAYYGTLRRPVALLPASPSKYMLLDPENGYEAELTENDLEQIDAEAHMFYVGLPDQIHGVGGWLKFSLKKCWHSDGWVIFLSSLVAGIIPMLTPLVTQTIFSDIIPISDRQGHIMVIQVMMVAAFATAGVSITRGIALLRIKGRVHLFSEAAIWIRILSLPAAFFRKFEAGDLSQRMSSISQMTMLLSGTTVSTLLNALFSFWSLLVMVYYSWQLTLAAILFEGIYLLAAAFLVGQIIRYKRRMMVATGETAGTVLQLLNGIGKFRLKGAEAQAFFLWSKQFGEQWKWNRAMRWKSNWLEVINTVQPVLLSMVLFFLTMYWMDDGGKTGIFISQPDFMGFNAALVGLNTALTGMISIIINVLDIVPQIERLKPVLEATPEVGEDKVEAGELTGKIEISHVSFRYSPDKPLVLQNISMAIRPGQFVAIVGGSGCGKSTLVRLLLGFEQPESGVIYFDGQDFSEISASSVRSQMGVVLQSGQLMAGDICSNIIGSTLLTIDDAWQAAEMVGLADDIRAMPMGMHTMISEGATNISGGQRQRILIARSIVNRPRIIIFDEATSALDNRTQAIVTESLQKLKATRIVIAHRLSTIVNADMLYVMDKGQIVESGTFEKLMEQDGLFASLARRQLV